MTWHAQMIAADQEFEGAPLLRHEFELSTGHGAAASASFTVTALGIVEAWINGRRISDDQLTPGWTSYEWRLRYSEYDVAALLAPRSVIGLALGNGWYRGRLGWAGDSQVYGDTLGGFAELAVTFEDGFVQLIVTDSTWRSGPSAVTANDLYDGQTIDARRDRGAWLKPGFVSKEWTGVHGIDFDTGKLVPNVAPRVTSLAEIAPVDIWTSPAGRTLVDFGQNLVGHLRVRLAGPRGTVVEIHHAEVLEHDELGTRPLRSASATDRFILSGEGDEFEPTLTFHGFRYAEITGWPGGVTADAVTAVVVGSELQRTGTFRSSDPLLDRFHENVVWGMRGNFVSVPTDCPQRDERLGWTGDIAAFAPTAAFLSDADAFLRDWLVDVALEQEHADGVIPFVVPDPLKYLGLPTEAPVAESTALWSDAGVWVPWALYQAYGDSAVLEAQFDSMSAHVRRVRTMVSPSGVWDTGFQFGDWLDPDAPPADPFRAKADKGVVATACAFRSAQTVAATAEVLGRSAEAEEFEGFAAELKAAFRTRYLDEGRIFSDCTTVYAMAIVFGILDPLEQRAAGARLAELVAESDYLVSTGFAGTPFICDALSMTGHLDDAYRLLLERSCPSWLYPVTMGATTIWERWDSMLPDGSINPGQMTSFNHYALGAVADWMHRVVGGISPASPGYRDVLISPQPGGGLTEVETTLMTAAGRIAVQWTLDAGRLRVQAEVPADVRATVRLPGRADVTIYGGQFDETVLLPRTLATSS